LQLSGPTSCGRRDRLARRDRLPDGLVTTKEGVIEHRNSRYERFPQNRFRAEGFIGVL